MKPTTVHARRYLRRLGHFQKLNLHAQHKNTTQGTSTTQAQSTTQDATTQGFKSKPLHKVIQQIQETPQAPLKRRILPTPSNTGDTGDSSKSTQTQTPIIPNTFFGEHEHIPDPVKEIKVYPVEKCSIDTCKKYAVGKSDLCKKHGGDPLIRENLMTQGQTPSFLAQLTKYDPNIHPSLFLDLAREGLSEVEIAARFEVSIHTMRGWTEQFYEFNSAYEIGAVIYESWWLQEGKGNLGNRNYNTTLFKFLTGNKLGWTEKIESKNVNINAGVLVVPSKISQEEWEKKYAT